MPRELIAPAREQTAFRECASLPLAEGQVRIRSLYAAAKHGTEMSLFKGYAGPRGGFDSDLRLFDNKGSEINFPVALGNMGVGEVIELGPGVTKLKEGDRVFHYGPFREEHVWPETARVLPDGVPWQAAVCLDPADFALGAVRDGHVRIGDFRPRRNQSHRATALPSGWRPSDRRPRPAEKSPPGRTAMRRRPRARPRRLRRRFRNKEGHRQSRR
jgi:hypothetical protein